MPIDNGFGITVPSDSAGSYSRGLRLVSYPDINGLKALHYLGGSVEASIRNRAPLWRDGQEIGLIDVTDANALRVVGGSGSDLAIRTSFIDVTNDLTVCGIFTNTGGTEVMLGNSAANVWDGTNPLAGAVAMGLDPTGKAAFGVSNGSGMRVVSVAIPVGQPVFQLGYVRGTEVGLFTGSGGALVKTVSPTPFTRTRSATPFYLGRGGSTTPHGTGIDFKIHATALHGGAVLDADVLRAYKYLRQRYAERGVAVA